MEIKNLGISKGRAAKFWLKGRKWDFLLAAGDDYTDEEMFEALPDGAYSIKVGINISKAMYRVDTPDEFRSLLKELTRKQHAET